MTARLTALGLCVIGCAAAAALHLAAAGVALLVAAVVLHIGGHG